MRRAILALLLGCSSSSTGTTATGGDAGVGPDGKALPRVVIASEIAAGTHADCVATGSLLAIGSFGDPSAEPSTVAVYDGASFADGVVSVSCTVAPEGDGFHVSAQAALTGAAAGSFLVSGHFTTSGDQKGISGTTSGRSAAYAENDCVARYTQPLETAASGRVWAELDCENATDASQHACKVTTRFRFENCKQE